MTTGQQLNDVTVAVGSESMQGAGYLGGGAGGPACERCGSLTYCSKWEQAFGVKLCSSCKKDDKLISKVGAK